MPKTSCAVGLVDIPARYELFILDEEKGEKKVTYVLDTRSSSLPTPLIQFNTH